MTAGTSQSGGSASANTLSGHVIVGDWLSNTVMICMQVVSLPDWSVNVQVIGMHAYRVDAAGISAVGSIRRVIAYGDDLTAGICNLGYGVMQYVLQNIFIGVT